MCPENDENDTPKKPDVDIKIEGKDSLFTVPTEEANVKEIKVSKTEEGERTQRARETLSFMLVFGLLALFLSSFIFAGTVDEAIKLIQAISSALTGLIGAVLGYYFGTTTTAKRTEPT